MFGAVFLFVLFESIFYNNNLSGIAFIISIPIFILSLIKVIIDILEDINDKITTYLKNMEHQAGYSYSLTWEDLTQIRSCSDSTLNSVIENIISNEPDLSHLKDDAFKYYHSRKHRKTIRSCRRFFLYIEGVKFSVSMGKIFFDKNQICIIVLSKFLVFCCRIIYLIIVLPIRLRLYMNFIIFCSTNNGISNPFSWALPTPASGISWDFLGIL